MDDNTAKVCDCMQLRRQEQLIKSSRITPAFEGKTFGGFIAKNRPPIVRQMLMCANKYTKALLASPLSVSNWLVLCGEPGSGKTHLAMAVANEAIKAGIPTVYFQHVEGINELRDVLRTRDESGVGKRLDALKTARVLVWDDLFKRKGEDRPSGFAIETAFEVLNSRYLNLLPTIITTEHTPEQLMELDMAIGSRIIERSKGSLIVVEDPAANYRLGSGD